MQKKCPAFSVQNKKFNVAPMLESTLSRDSFSQLYGDPPTTPSTPFVHGGGQSMSSKQDLLYNEEVKRESSLGEHILFKKYIMLLKERDNEIKKLQQQRENEIKKLQQQKDNEIKKLQQQRDDEIQKLQHQRDEETEKLQHKDEEIAKLREQNLEHVKVIAAKQKETDDLSTQVKDLRKELKRREIAMKFWRLNQLKSMLDFKKREEDLRELLLDLQDLAKKNVVHEAELSRARGDLQAALTETIRLRETKDELEGEVSLLKAKEMFLKKRQNRSLNLLPEPPRMTKAESSGGFPRARSSRSSRY